MCSNILKSSSTEYVSSLALTLPSSNSPHNSFVRDSAREGILVRSPGQPDYVLSAWLNGTVIGSEKQLDRLWDSYPESRTSQHSQHPCRVQGSLAIRLG